MQILIAPGDFAIKVKWEGLICSYKIKKWFRKKNVYWKGNHRSAPFPFEIHCEWQQLTVVRLLNGGEYSTIVSKMLLSSLSLRISSP